ncbi:MAG: methyl-accepting chemotaxis protein [Desulfotalea sp.]
MTGFTIKRKLICAFAATTLIPIIVLSTFLIFEIREDAVSSFVSSTNRELTQVDEGFVFFMNGVETSVGTLVNNTLAKQADDTLPNYSETTSKKLISPTEAGPYAVELHNFFKQVQEANNTYLEVYMGTEYGAYSSSAPSAMPAGYDPRKRAWYADALTKNKMYTTAAYLTLTTKEAVLSVVAPVKKNGSNVGVAGIDVSLSLMTDLIGNIKIGETGFVVLVQADGTILANPKHPETNFKHINELNVSGYSLLGKMDSGSVQLELGDESYLATVHTSSDLGYKFIGLISISEVMAESATLTKIIILISAILIAAFLLFALFIANTIVRPISHTAEMLKDIAQGEGDLTMRLAAKNKDEMGELAHWFNLFMERLQDIIKQITANSSSVDTSAIELSRISTELTDGATNTSMRANSVAAAAEEMSTNLNNVAAAMEESSTNTSMVAAAAEEMNATINEIAKNAENARAISSDAVQQSTQAGERMNELNIAAAAISKVTETITEISEQTNLLALNATIEAARAGEAGKGFAVVANEIKELAKQTAEATLNIKTQIGDVQSTTSITAKEINEVANVITNVNDIVGIIATAVEEQSAATQEIATNITQVSEGIEEVNGNVSQSSVASSEITENITLVNSDAENMSRFSSQVSDNSGDLEGMAAQLNVIVKKFKV